jgi:hypothetical protein
MYIKNRLIFSILVRVLYKLGIFAGVLSFSFDKVNHSVRRSRVLECYCFIFIAKQMIFATIFYIRIFIYAQHFKIVDEVLLVVIILQLLSLVLNWVVLLICLISNRQAIVDLVNDGLKIEKDFRSNFTSKPWNFKLLYLMFFKDIIYCMGHTYFAIYAKRDDGELFHFYKIISIFICSVSLGFAENLKIISLFRVSHFLGVLNKSLSRGKMTGNTESIREISKRYERLLTFAENICKPLRFRTTTILIVFLIVTSTEV